MPTPEPPGPMTALPSALTTVPEATAPLETYSMSPLLTIVPLATPSNRCVAPARTSVSTAVPPETSSSPPRPSIVP